MTTEWFSEDGGREFCPECGRPRFSPVSRRTSGSRQAQTRTRDCASHGHAATSATGIPRCGQTLGLPEIKSTKRNTFVGGHSIAPKTISANVASASP